MGTGAMRDAYLFSRALRRKTGTDSGNFSFPPLPPSEFSGEIRKFRRILFQFGWNSNPIFGVGNGCFVKISLLAGPGNAWHVSLRVSGFSFTPFEIFRSLLPIVILKNILKA